MAFTNSLTTNHPTGDTNRRDMDTIIKDGVKGAFRERLNVDHDFTVSGTTVDGADVGKHRKVSLIGAISTPSPGSEQGVIYGKLVSGQLELFYKNQSGTEKQLTSGGQLNLEAADFLSGTFDDATIGVGGSGLYVKNTGIHKSQINADVADGSTLEKDGSTGALKVKAGGVDTTQLADDAVTADKIGPPAKGSSADMLAVPVIACGYYGGSATSAKTIYAFPAGVQIRNLVINGNSKGMQAIRHNHTDHGDGGTHAWYMDSGLSVGSCTIGTNSFTLTAASTFNIDDSHSYYWYAVGEWKAS